MPGPGSTSRSHPLSACMSATNNTAPATFCHRWDTKCRKFVPPPQLSVPQEQRKQLGPFPRFCSVLPWPGLTDTLHLLLPLTASPGDRVQSETDWSSFRNAASARINTTRWCCLCFHGHRRVLVAQELQKHLLTPKILAARDASRGNMI